MNYPPELTAIPEWQKYGVSAESDYSDEMPYHNWPHGVEVAAEAVIIANRCLKRGIVLHKGRLAVGGDRHDSGFHRDHRALGYATKEQYSVHLTRNSLELESVDPVFIEGVCNNIIDTTHGTKRTELHSITLHWGDVANPGKVYSIFARKSLLLLREKRLKEPDLNFYDFQQAMPAFINFTIEEALRELPQIGEPIETAGSFDTVAAQNLDLFMKERSEAELAEKLGMAA